MDATPLLQARQRHSLMSVDRTNTMATSVETMAVNASAPQVGKIDVSVIIPAYNSANLIGASIESALRQRNVSVEVIVVDDGSTDGTDRVLQSYGDTVRVIRQSNQGAYVARNAAAAVARGDWLAFLDADDEWSEDKLAKQLSLAAPNVGLIYSDCANRDDSGRVTGRVSDAHELAQGKIFDELLTVNFISTSTAVIRRRDFEELRGFTTRIRGCADWDLWLRYTLLGGEVRAHPEALAVYRWHSGQMSKSFLARQRDRLDVIGSAIELARKRDVAVSRGLERRAYGTSWATAAWFVAATDRWQASRWCLRALVWQPFELNHYRLLVKSILGVV
jgi:glycosyltransferase involved in cell wall biosynthesis